MSKEMILVTVERFTELEDKELKLESLYQHGVDNLDGYGDSVDTYNEWVHGDD
jgi:hypothetical protein